MSVIQQLRQILTALLLVLILTTTAACSGAVQDRQPTNLSAIGSSGTYGQLERGNSPDRKDFGNWVVQTASELVQDAYVHDNNKLNVVITPEVRPYEVQPLARSLAQGFRRNFPNQDLTVLMYAPDKKLIGTAKYDTQTNRIEYE